MKIKNNPFQDVEMADTANGKEGVAAANGETESISSEDEPGLQGQMSPLTPGREENNRNGGGGGSPGAGSISPLTPPNPPPLPPSAATVVNMEVESQVCLSMISRYLHLSNLP